MILLLVLISLVSSKSLIVIDESVRSISAFKAALHRAYESHMSKTDFIAIAVGKTIVLDWTSSTKSSALIKSAIDDLPLRSVIQKVCKYSNTNYDALLSVGLTHKADELFLVVDNMRDTSGTTSAITSRKLQQGGTKVYPIGIGSCVLMSDLKNVAGPCAGFWGCVSPFSFFHARDYKTIKRDMSRDLLDGEGTLTAWEIAVTVIVATFVGLLALWCIIYSCCYLPRVPTYRKLQGAIPRVSFII